MTNTLLASYTPMIDERSLYCIFTDDKCSPHLMFIGEEFSFHCVLTDDRVLPTPSYARTFVNILTRKVIGTYIMYFEPDRRGRPLDMV